jgi:hypothetical protein
VRDFEDTGEILEVHSVAKRRWLYWTLHLKVMANTDRSF